MDTIIDDSGVWIGPKSYKVLKLENMSQEYTQQLELKKIQQEQDEKNKSPSEAEILRAQIKASSDRQEFLEDVIAEMAMVVYD